jgi:hypothetical protein
VTYGNLLAIDIEPYGILLALLLAQVITVKYIYVVSQKFIEFIFSWKLTAFI